MFLVMSVIFAVAVFDSCVSQGGMGKNNYVASVVTDTLTVMLPDCEDEFCEVRVYGNGARFFASDYVINGCVKFCINTIPAGRHRVFIHAGNVVADESFLKDDMFLCQTVSNGAIYGICVRKSFPSKGFMFNFAVDANIINK